MEKVEISKDTRLPSGIACIDELTEGGLEPGIITEIFGEGGSGKTNLCIIFSLSALLSGQSVIFLDSEGFSSERFLQVT
ncbi:MAG: DNA repair protein RadB, partial [Candidatus Thermoplasmatota archaeon]|nr:DNA repair protein RadB [Candidatus Thermoplasmatota archaeon]